MLPSCAPNSKRTAGTASMPRSVPTMNSVPTAGDTASFD